MCLTLLCDFHPSLPFPPPAGRLQHLYADPHKSPKMKLHYGDLTDTTNLVYIISQVLVRLSPFRPPFSSGTGV